MAEKPIVFAMANPVPEIMPDVAKEAGVFIIGTGRSDYPNQINNVLAFPGLFRGLLDNKIRRVTDEIKLSVAMAIADYVKAEDLGVDKIIPSALDKNVAMNIADVLKYSH